MSTGNEHQLEDVDRQIVDVCLRLVQFLGFPKSVGECYGVLFVAERPLALDDVIQRSQLSKGSASQALKQLRQLGAIMPEYVQGDRRDHFVIEPNLEHIVRGLLSERLHPALKDWSYRLAQLEKQAGRDTRRNRCVRRLRKWEGKANQALPVLERLFDIGEIEK